MHKFGLINLYLGVFLSVFGLIFGFYDLLQEGPHEDIGLLAAVPVGVLFMFLGTSIVLFYAPGKKNPERDASNNPDSF